jgi:hypothetical protein
VAVQTPPPTPLPFPSATPTPEFAVQSTVQPSERTPVSRTASRFRAPRGPSVHLEKYDKLFSESESAARRRGVRPLFLGLFVVVIAALWGLWHACRSTTVPPAVSSQPPVTAPPAAGPATHEPLQVPPAPNVPSGDEWRKFAEQMKDQGLQQAQRALGELGNLTGQGPKVVFGPPPPERLDRPLKRGDKVDAEYVDGGLRLESSPLPPALIVRATKGSKVAVELNVESNGTVRKGRRVDGDRDLAAALIQAAKQT